MYIFYIIIVTKTSAHRYEAFNDFLEFFENFANPEKMPNPYEKTFVVPQYAT